MKNFTILFLAFTFLSILPKSAFSQNYEELTKLIAEDRHKNGRFGFDVDIYNNWTIVGAPTEHLDANGLDSLSNAGAVYIFERDSSGLWDDGTKVTPPTRNAGDYFGAEVKINGRFAFVGAYFRKMLNQGNLRSIGSVFIYERTDKGVWTLVQEILSPDGNFNQNFGWSLDVFNNTLVVGAITENFDRDGENELVDAGAVYVYQFDEMNKWQFHQKLTPADRNQDDRFGYDVSVHEGNMVISAPRHNETPGQAPSKQWKGAVYTYEVDIAGIWIEKQKLEPSDAREGRFFGSAVKVLNDLFIVGDHDDFLGEGQDSLNNAGSAYAFRKINDQWVETQKLVSPVKNETDYFGYKLDMADSTLIIGSLFGYIGGEGSKVFHGGASHIYDLNRNGEIEFRQIISANDRQRSDESASGVAIYGNTIVLGSRRHDLDLALENHLSNSGAAYIIELCQPTLEFIEEFVCDSLLSPSGNYIWKTTGIYFDTITSNSSCDTVFTIDLTVSNLEVDITLRKDTLYAQTNGGTSYLWYECIDDDRVLISGETKAFFIPNEEGRYAVEAIDDNGCSKLSSCFAYFTSGTTDEERGILPRVYPNPTSSFFIIDQIQDDAQLYISDLLGRQVCKVSLNKDEKMKVDISYLSPGIYSVYIIMNDLRHTMRVRKQ